MKFADVIAAKEARKPLALVEIPPRVWAQTWTERPNEVVTCGWRSLSETVLGEVTGAAISRANRIVPGEDERSRLWADAYNAAVQQFTVGRALTHAECADVPYFDMPDMQVQAALDPAGAAWLYARFEVALVGASVLASEEDPPELALALGSSVRFAASLSPARRAQVSRHLRAALDVLEGR